MELRRIVGDGYADLVRQPETGMGFQLVLEARPGSGVSWLVLVGEIAVEMQDDDDARSWLTARRVPGGLDHLFADPMREVSLWKPLVVMSRAYEVPGPPFSSFPIASRFPESAIPSKSALIKESETKEGQRFFRFSSTSRDRRVDPNTGSFTPGTYGTTRTDRPLAPSGFAAVGRYALPNNKPASFRYAVWPRPGTRILIGTVAPAYGQSGGGVEVLFPEGAENVRDNEEAHRLPDE